MTARDAIYDVTYAATEASNYAAIRSATRHETYFEVDALVRAAITSVIYDPPDNAIYEMLEDLS